MNNLAQNKRIRKYNKLALACSLILAGSPAVWAQTDQTSQADSDDEMVLEEVIVTGMRASMESAVELKRQSDTVIEAITSVELGQFADDSIAGALQRIPGVQIEVDSAGTDGDRVSIRGMGSEFVNSTLNGRTLLSSGNEAKSLRKMNFNVFPSSVLGGVWVAKGATAATPESGLAVLVDLQTLRPLEI